VTHDWSQKVSSESQLDEMLNLVTNPIFSIYYTGNIHHGLRSLSLMCSLCFVMIKQPEMLAFWSEFEISRPSE